MDADDVITKEEQIFLLLKAKAKCERHLKAKVPKVHGECSHIDPDFRDGAWSTQGGQLKTAHKTPFFWLSYEKDFISQGIRKHRQHILFLLLHMPDSRGLEDAKVMVMGLQPLLLYPKPRQCMGGISHQYTFAAGQKWCGKQSSLPPSLLFPSNKLSLFSSNGPKLG